MNENDELTVDLLGHWVDLSTYQFDDGEDTTVWLQMMPHGEFSHPTHGKIVISPERVSNFVRNFDDGFRGQDLDVDYEHKERTGKAAGWIKKVEARSDGLWGLVDFAKSAYGEIREGSWRYFSPEFAPKWKNPTNEEERKDVLFGGALTNRPFLKGILPINLSELVTEASVSDPDEGGSSVNREQLEKLARKLGVDFEEDTQDQDLLDKVVAAGEAEEAPTPEPVAEDDSPVEEPVPEPVAAVEPDAELVKANERIAKLEATIRLQEVDASLQKLSEGDRVIAPKHKDKAREIITALPSEQGDQVIALLSEVVQDGVVSLSEEGGTAPRTQSDGATEEFLNKVQKYQDENEGTDYADAVETVSAQEPELFERYRYESFSTEEVS